MHVDCRSADGAVAEARCHQSAHACPIQAVEVPTPHMVKSNLLNIEAQIENIVIISPPLTAPGVPPNFIRPVIVPN